MTPQALMLAILCAALPAGLARADSLPDLRKQPVRAAKSSADAPKPGSAEHCARYGEGFVPVVGSDSCVKIGGRLRIDLGASGRTQVFSAPGDGISPAAHLRVGR